MDDVATYVTCFLAFAILFSLIAREVARGRRLPQPNWEYDTARSEVISALIRSASSHVSGDLHSIEVEHARIDANLPRSADSRFDSLHAALNMLDGWIDSSYHEWQYYRGITKDDWPKLALVLAEDISHDRAISHPLILSHFAKKPKGSSGGPLPGPT